MLRKSNRVVWYIGGVSTGTGAVGIVWVNVGQIRSKSYTLKEWVNVPLKSPPCRVLVGLLGGIEAWWFNMGEW